MSSTLRILVAAVLVGASVPAWAASETLEVNPVALEAPERGLDLTLRVTFPRAGARLPVVLFSHGAGLSKDDYRPLADFWAANGFVVIQPTHLDAEAAGLKAGDPRLAHVWRTRIEDLKRILDGLGEIERRAPALAGRMDEDRIVVAGHSYGGHTAQALLGAKPTDPGTGRLAAFNDRRVIAGLLLAAPGAGGESLAPAWRDRRYLDVDWSGMRGPALVVVGDRDDQRVMTVRGFDWRADAYRLSPPGGKCLWTMAGAGHYLGGVDGGRRPTLEGDPARLAVLQRASLAFLRTVTGQRPADWPGAVRAAVERSGANGGFTCK